MRSGSYLVVRRLRMHLEVCSPSRTGPIRKQFVPLQTALAHGDALDEYIQHVGSALRHPPGVAHRGGFVGETLFA